jgi:hypothetical protein
MTDSVQIDAAAWPLVVVRIPSRFDLPVMRNFIRGIDGILSRKARFAAIIDTTALAKFPNAVERHWFAESMGARAMTEEAYNLGNAVIIGSVTARAVLTAINWLRPTPVTQHLVGNFEDALEWCCLRLTKAGVGLSPAIGELRAGRGAVARAR